MQQAVAALEKWRVLACRSGCAAWAVKCGKAVAAGVTAIAAVRGGEARWETGAGRQGLAGRECQTPQNPELAGCCAWPWRSGVQPSKRNSLSTISIVEKPSR